MASRCRWQLAASVAGRLHETLMQPSSTQHGCGPRASRILDSHAVEESLMHRFVTLTRWSLIALTVVVSPLRAQSASSRTPAPEVFALLRQVVADSLEGGGRQAEQHLLAADSITRALLRSAAVAVDSSAPVQGVICPGTTIAPDSGAAPLFGYHVQVALRATPDSAGWLLRVAKWCTSGTNSIGRQRGYMTTGLWEIRRVEGRWRIVRTLERDVS